MAFNRSEPVVTLSCLSQVLGMLVGLEDKEAHAPGKATATVATFPLYVCCCLAFGLPQPQPPPPSSSAMHPIISLTSL